MRPMFHFIPKRIEPHVCICFVAYKVYKELERILKLSKINQGKDDNHIKNQTTRRWQLNNQNNVAYTKPSINRDAFWGKLLAIFLGWRIVEVRRPETKKIRSFLFED